MSMKVVEPSVSVFTIDTTLTTLSFIRALAALTARLKLSSGRAIELPLFNVKLSDICAFSHFLSSLVTPSTWLNVII